jgi:hypothetical protein
MALDQRYPNGPRDLLARELAVDADEWNMRTVSDDDGSPAA